MKMTALFLLALAVSPAAVASTITYTISATGTGTLGSASFTNALITFTQVTDTALISQDCANNPSFTQAGSVCAPGTTSNTVTVAGVGTATLQDSTGFFDFQPNQNIGIYDFTINGQLLAQGDAAFATYDLLSPFGPIVDGSYAGVTNLFPDPTNLGTLSGTFTSNVTFTATATATATPEPGTSVLVSMGAGLLFLFKNRQFKNHR